MLKKLCFALALLLLTTGCSGLGLWLAVAGTLRERQPAPPPAQTVQAEAMPDAPAQPPASLWDPASLALSAREGRYRLNDPFGSGEELPLPAEVTEAAREVAVTDLAVEGENLYVALLRLPFGEEPRGTLYRSADRGAHWAALPLPVPELEEDELAAELFVSFWSAQGGALVLETDRARRFLWLTADGGAEWTLRAVLQGGDPDAWLCGGGFVSEELGFLCSTAEEQTAPRVSVTRDGGASWQPLSVELPALPGLRRAEALSPQRMGEAIVLPVRVYRRGSGAGQQVSLLQYLSRDGGETWAFADR